MDPKQLIFIGGIFHFGILLASVMLPKVLEWKAVLAKLDVLLRQIIWVHGAYVVFVIIGFGVLSVLFADDLASGIPLARGVCFFIAIFWAVRLFLQFFVFDAKPFLKTAYLKVGYHSLTFVFIYLVVAYGYVAFL